MTVKNKNGFKISRSGVASQVVLLCHGGWVESDGATTIPAGLRVCYYAGHGHYTIGGSVYKAVTDSPKEAAGGLLKRITMSDEDLTAFAGMINKSVEETRQVKLDEAVGVYDSFGGGNPMFNYALSREPAGARYENEKALFQKHADGNVDPDVDLIMMKTTRGRHLSDVFKIVKEMGYSTMHFAACRVPYGATPSEVAN